MKFEDRVVLHEFELNDTDDQVIEYIRRNRDRISQLTISAAAKDLFTVPNTIMRVCRKLDYSGWSDMKALMQSEKKEEQENEIVYEVIPPSISQTLKLDNTANLMQVVKLMKKASMVHFIGVGDSRRECEMMAANLMCIGKEAVYYMDYHEIEFRCARCTANDLMVFISVRGTNERLIKAAQDAKACGAHIVAVTHFYKNPLSELAEIPIFFWGEPRIINGYNVTDRMGLDLVLRQLSEIFWRTYYM